MKVLVTGATGYVGGRLVPHLLAAGHQVRVMVRDAARIAGRPWIPQVEIAVGDILDRDSTLRALDGGKGSGAVRDHREGDRADG